MDAACQKRNLGTSRTTILKSPDDIKPVLSPDKWTLLIPSQSLTGIAGSVIIRRKFSAAGSFRGVRNQTHGLDESGSGRDYYQQDSECRLVAQSDQDVRDDARPIPALPLCEIPMNVDDQYLLQCRHSAQCDNPFDSLLAFDRPIRTVSNVNG